MLVAQRGHGHLEYAVEGAEGGHEQGWEEEGGQNPATRHVIEDLREGGEGKLAAGIGRDSKSVYKVYMMKKTATPAVSEMAELVAATAAADARILMFLGM